MTFQQLPDTYYSHLVFDKSLTGQDFRYSYGVFTPPSFLKTSQQKLPVAHQYFYSPPNSLELTWCSRPGGDWHAEIHVEHWRGRTMRQQGNTLTFWCYTENPIQTEGLPMLVLQVSDGRLTLPLRLSKVITEIHARSWTYVQVPLTLFNPDTRELDLGQLAKVIFTQSLDDNEEHTLYLDEIKIRDLRDSKSVSPPTHLAAHAFDRHVDLQWEPVSDPEVEYYVIYRSDDGETYTPVGIQNPTFHLFTDYLGCSDAAVSYRVTAVNHAYQESSPSRLVSATTHPLDDDGLLAMVQEVSFRYYWEHAHPDAGLSLECVPGDEHMIALGASGFGLMALIVAVERGFVTRDAALRHLDKALRFLENADRFHGVWPHFLDGRSGKVIPFFGKYDDGGDLVETAFMMQALLAVRQYFDRNTPKERQLHKRITDLWETVEWDWYRNPNDPDFLFWHWSPNHGWQINHPIIGWNEAMIIYLLAIASPTHPVPASLYFSGWASQSERAQLYRQIWGKTRDGDHYQNGNSYYGLPLSVGVGPGGPLFFTHYSFLGFDPRGKRDRYANYYKNNQIQTLINYRYCVANPGGYKGYGKDFWGLSASIDYPHDLAHDPTPATTRARSHPLPR